MESPYTYLTEEERAKRRAQRAEARKKKRRARRRRQLCVLLPALLILVLLLSAWAKHRQVEPTPAGTDPPHRKATVVRPEAPSVPEVFSASETQSTVHLGEAFASEHAVLIDLNSGSILAEKGWDAVIAPASMTKILTALVAAEHVTDLEDTFTITREITDYCFVNDCSVVGLAVDETVTIRELFYGTILSSGADAALGLATYVAGSQEAFVVLMNEKLEELGLSRTAHFTNCVGLFEDSHACTVYDIAMILKAAMENDLCRAVLSAHTYETAPTSAHPEGQVLSNWFLRRIEDKDTGAVKVAGAKTGYVNQAGSCAASCGTDADGNAYLCVTAKTYSSWRCIYDHVELYKTYCN